MQILEKNLNGRGFKLMIDNLDDLWHLYNIIDEHDIVASKTYRRLEKSEDKLRPDKTPKKVVWLAIEVHEVEFHEFSNRLRVHGTIVKGPDELGLKTYHTLNFNPGDSIELEKPEPWRKHKLELLRNAIESAMQPKVTLVAIEDDNAVITQLFHYGIRNISTIERTGSGKLYNDTKSVKGSNKVFADSKLDFFKKILIQLNQIRSEETPLIFVGPGFTKEDFLRYCKDNKLAGADNIMLEPTGQAGMVGVQEAIKRGVIKRVVQDSRVTFETEMIEKLLEGIATNGPVTYGKQETRNAVTAGAVESLLIIDKLIRTKNQELEQIITEAEGSGGNVYVISTVHDAGKQLESLGGIAALLRYKINY